MKKLDWNAFWIVLVLCTLAGGLNQNYENMLLGFLFGFIAGLMFATIFLVLSNLKKT